MKRKFAEAEAAKKRARKGRAQRDGRALKVTWKKKATSHSADTLVALFREYGAVADVEMGSGGGKATVVFEEERADLERAADNHQVRNALLEHSP